MPEFMPKSVLSVVRMPEDIPFNKIVNFLTDICSQVANPFQVSEEAIKYVTTHLVPLAICNLRETSSVMRNT